MVGKSLHPVREALLDASIAGVLALLLFGPITGLILQGYEVRLEGMRPLILATIVLVGRFLFRLAQLTGWLDSPLGTLLRPRNVGVVVGEPHTHGKLIAWVVLAIALCLPFFIGKYWLTVVILALIYVLLGLGLNIVVGLAGLLDLGFVAFYAVGAYTYALGAQYLDMSFWLAIPLGALAAATFGAILGFPVLRMHGDYLAIVTLGFGEIVRLVLTNWVTFTGGPNGASVPAPTLFGLEFRRRVKDGTAFHDFFGLEYSTLYRYIFLYLILLAVVAVMILFVNRLRKMPIGRAWEALREDEIACRSLGINHVGVKLSAFSMGAMVGGIAGVFFAAYQGFINPSSFTFFESALILAIVVLGGLGSIVGVICAALLLTILPEMLRDFADYRVLIFGMVMVLMMIWRPRGLLAIRRPKFRKIGT